MADERRDLALGLAAFGVQALADVARAALVPVRVAARAPLTGPVIRRLAGDLTLQGQLIRMRLRDRIVELGEQLLDAPEVEIAIDRALEGPLTDTVTRAIVRHRVVERMAAQVVASTDVERVVIETLNSPLMVAVTEHVVTSPEMDRLVEHIAGSPEVRRALTQQSTSLAEEMVSGVRRRTVTLDDTAERAARGWLRRPKPRPT
jgi:hypothetical protein